MQKKKKKPGANTPGIKNRQAGEQSHDVYGLSKRQAHTKRRAQEQERLN